MSRTQKAVLLLLGIASAAFFSGCASVPNEEVADPQFMDVQSIHTANQTEEAIGVVTSVNENHQFVLVRTSYFPTLDPGQTLEIRRGLNPIGQISPSGERKGKLVVADVLEGDPRVGDKVIFHSVTKPAPSETENGFFARLSAERERKKQMHEFRKAAKARNELEKANSWTR